MLETAPRGLTGLRILSFESRKQSEMRMLIEKHGGLATLAASMREVPLNDNSEALDYARRLVAGEFDVTILMTGVGTRHLVDAVSATVGREEFLAAMQRTCLIVRGPKPAAVLREWKMRFDHHVPEPNTWRDLLTMLDSGISIAGKRVAVQEYGMSNSRLLAGLRERGATVTAVPVYRWAMPKTVARSTPPCGERSREPSTRYCSPAPSNSTTCWSPPRSRGCATAGWRPPIGALSAASARPQVRPCAIRDSPRTSNRTTPKWGTWCSPRRNGAGN